jgi:hypothetical protein
VQSNVVNNGFLGGNFTFSYYLSERGESEGLYPTDISQIEAGTVEKGQFINGLFFACISLFGILRKTNNVIKLRKIVYVGNPNSLTGSYNVYSECSSMS